MHNINLGVLLPVSTILPVGRDFEKGLKQALSSLSGTGINIELTKAFIGQGGTKQTEENITKLINYDSVDLITGIVSGRVIEAVAEKFNTYNTPFLVNNLGEYFPNPPILNEHIFLNTYQLWQDAWALGYWGVKTWGKKGMYVSAVYDAAYSYSHLFYEGMMAADQTSQWSFSVAPMPPAGQLSDMNVIFPYLEQYQPDFVLATFCGTETTLFLNEFIKRGWHKRTKLLGLPFLLTPFAPLDDDITIYTTALNTAATEADDKQCFYQLGHQTGTFLVEALQDYNGTSLQDCLAAQPNLITRGPVSFLPNNNADAATAVILKNEIKAHQSTLNRQVVAQTPAFRITNPALNSLANTLAVGWMNPYLCI